MGDRSGQVRWLYGGRRFGRVRQLGAWEIGYGASGSDGLATGGVNFVEGAGAGVETDGRGRDLGIGGCLFVFGMLAEALGAG